MIEVKVNRAGRPTAPVGPSAGAGPGIGKPLPVYAVNGTSFVAEKPRVWIAAFGGAAGDNWDLAPDGKRVAVVIAEGSAPDPGELPFNVIRYTLGA